MRKFMCVAVAALAGSVLAEGADEGLVEKESPKGWHLRIGPVMSPRVRVNMRGPRFALPAMPKSGFSQGNYSGNVPSGPSAGYVNRRYADGYVNPDDGTLDPDSIVPGLTWDWGARSVPNQYSSGRVEFHTDATRWSESVSSSSFSVGSGSTDERDFLVGVEAIGGWTFFDNGTFDAAIDVGFRFYGSGCQDAESRYGTSVTTTRSEYRFVDSYDASGWANVPDGSHAWEPGDADRVIGAMPTRREEQSGATSSTETRYYSGDARLNYRLWDLRLGPTLGWQVTDWFTLRGGVYGLLGLVDATLKADANTPNGSLRTSDSTCGAVFGMAFGLSAQFNITENIFLMGGVEYDWWTDSVDLNAGGANAEIELSDWVVSLGLGVEF